MRWHYDVTGAEPIIRDIPVYSSGALIEGQPMMSGPVATDVNNGRSIPAVATVVKNIIGVLQEPVTAANALAVVLTGYEKYAKHIINPFAVWLAEYSQTTTDTIILTGADATGKTCTSADFGTDHETGCWDYITSQGVGTGHGNLFCVGAITTTTVHTAVTDYDDYLKANAIGDYDLILHARYGATVAAGTVNLSAAALNKITGHLATECTGAMMVLENYIEGNGIPMQPLVISQHSGNNYKGDAPRFYGDVVFQNHLLGSPNPPLRAVT